MKRSQEALKYRRQALGALRICNRVASQDFPWTDRNVRSWQAVYCRALAMRSQILRDYKKSKCEKRHKE